VQVLREATGLNVRLTDERLAHILDHREMEGTAPALARTLQEPTHIVESTSDASDRLYYRPYSHPHLGDKLLCVVVKVLLKDTFIITAYLTDMVKRGTILWSRSD
jgi:hypothetical protein